MFQSSSTSTSTTPPLNQIIKKYLFFSLQAKVLSLLSPWNANFDTVSQINYWTVRTCCSVNFSEWADCTLSHWLFQNSFILRKTPMAKETKTWQQLQMLSNMVSPKRWTEFAKQASALSGSPSHSRSQAGTLSSLRLGMRPTSEYDFLGRSLKRCCRNISLASNF